MRYLALFLLILAACLGGLSAAQAAPRVVASIMPVFGIVAAVMGDLGKPELLLSGRLSEHTASFTPQQIQALEQADAVFMVAPGLEFKLGEISGSEAVNGKRFIELASAPGVATLPVRTGSTWEPDDHEAEHTTPEGEDGLKPGFDPHVWLDPVNGRAMTLAVAAELARLDPPNAAVYAANAAAFAGAIDRSAETIAQRLAGVKHKPFIVFHDAYHYFERRFGLSGAGSIADVQAATPSARRLGEIRDRIAAVQAVCVFREPQFDDRYVQTVIEGTTARSGVLDPLGADLPQRPEAYLRLLENLAEDFTACLAG